MSTFGEAALSSDAGDGAMELLRFKELSGATCVRLPTEVFERTRGILRERAEADPDVKAIVDALAAAGIGCDLMLASGLIIARADKTRVEAALTPPVAAE